MPCLLPVMTIADGFEVEASLTTGKNVLMPWMTPKRLVSSVFLTVSSTCIKIRPSLGLIYRSKVLVISEAALQTPSSVQHEQLNGRFSSDLLLQRTPIFKNSYIQHVGHRIIRDG